jgi:SNF2 family DNA or RNA helicase
MQIIDNKALVVRTKNPARITAAIPKSQELESQDGVTEVAVHWGLKEAQVLRQLGIKKAPSPIDKDYGWPGIYKPMAHQRDTASFLTLHPRSFCFNEQGTGKTASAIWAADYLLEQGVIKRVLVVCPLSIMQSAWQADLFKFAVHRSVNVAYGDRKKRKAIIEGVAEFVIINFDGVGIVQEEIKKSGFDLIIIDEANAYKNSRTERFKVMRHIVEPSTWIWMMTGTPAAQSPLDAYGLAKLCVPANTPMMYGTFRDSVMYQLTRFKWVPKPNAEDVVHKILQPAIRYTKKECLDLPDVTHTFRHAPLSAQQSKFYKQLKKDFLFEVVGEEVTAVNAAANLNKLLQIACGAVYTNTKNVIEFDVSNRLNVILEVIEECTNKVLVFVPYTHAINLLADFLNKNGVTNEIINGDVSVNKRTDIFKRFQEGTNPKVLLIQPQAAAHGVTLTAANVVVWYAPVTSSETYLQANARVHRQGQKNPVTVVHIEGSPVETKLYAMLQNKLDFHTKIIDLYKNELSESP